MSNTELVTKSHLDLILAHIHADLTALKWMMVLTIGGVFSIVMKTYF